MTTHNEATSFAAAIKHFGGIPLILHCPECRERHIDEGEWATKLHKSHACQSCGFIWQPALVPTLGVKFLPGTKNGEAFERPITKEMLDGTQGEPTLENALPPCLSCKERLMLVRTQTGIQPICDKCKLVYRLLVTVVEGGRG